MQVQLVRIQLRVPEYGWTTQKVFHLLNCLVCSMRAGVFLFRPALDTLHPVLLKVLLMDLPGATSEPCIAARTSARPPPQRSRRVCNADAAQDVHACRFALLHDVHASCAVLGRDLPSGTQHAHWIAAAGVCRHQYRRLRSPGEEYKLLFANLFMSHLPSLGISDLPS